MGKASSSKKVARAARTGGGRTRRGSSSWAFPVLMALVVVLGTAGVVYSREQRKPDTSPPRAGGPGRQGDHWHTAIGFDICGTFAPAIQEEADPLGIHTHGDGVVHTHPFTSRAAGANARLGVFLDTVNAKVTTTEVRLPSQEAKRNGMECDGRSAAVRVKVWASRNPDDEGDLFRGDPADIRLGDSQLITVAFLPRDAEIRRPPSEAQLDRLTDVGPATTQLPGPTEVTTTTPASTTTSPP